MRSPGAARAGCGAGAAAPSAPGLPDPCPEALHIPRDVCDAPLPTNSTYPPYDDADAFDTNAELAAPRRTPQVCGGSTGICAVRTQTIGRERAGAPQDERLDTSRGFFHFYQGSSMYPESVRVALYGCSLGVSLHDLVDKFRLQHATRGRGKPALVASGLAHPRYRAPEQTDLLATTSADHGCCTSVCLFERVGWRRHVKPARTGGVALCRVPWRRRGGGSGRGLRRHRIRRMCGFRCPPPLGDWPRPTGTAGGILRKVAWPRPAALPTAARRSSTRFVACGVERGCLVSCVRMGTFGGSNPLPSAPDIRYLRRMNVLNVACKCLSLGCTGLDTV